MQSDPMRPSFQNRPTLSAPVLTLGLALASLTATSPAQMHHVDAPEHVTRALGVYEWTGDLEKPTAARFVPVSLFINGSLQDAGLYLARPVPFALGAGDVYSLEHAGASQGLLDLEYAQRAATDRALGKDDPEGGWYGYGKFTPLPAAKVAALPPSAHLPVIQTDGKATATTEDAAKTGGTGSGSAGRTADDADRPTLRHRDPSQDATRRREYGTRAKQASVTAVGPGPGDDPDRPVLGRAPGADAATPPLTGLPAGMHQTVGVSDPVHRDTHDFARAWDSPAERSETMARLEAVARSRVARYLLANSLVPSALPLPSETSSAVAAPAGGALAGGAPTGPAAANPASGTGTDADEAGAPPKLQRGMPSPYRPPGTAVAPAGNTSAAPLTPSRAADTPPHSAGSHTLPSTAAHGTRSSVHRPSKRGAGSPALVLEQGALAGYTLSYGGLPTFVYTAAASVASARQAPPATSSGNPAVSGVAAASSPRPAPAAVFVTVVAQRLPSGDLQIALSSVTDSLHLDRDPRLRLIDAVDPDDSHRASLLFELRGASARQFALYRLTAAQAEPIFTTASIE